MATSRAAITVLGARADVEARWRELRPEYVEEADAAVSFVDAPGDRGTEIHVDLEKPGRLREYVQKLTGSEPESKVKDDLRRFKQVFETGVVARSDGTPEGEAAERKLKQRPAQPLDDSEREKAGV